MTVLIATLGDDGGTWAHLREVIAGDTWEHVYLLSSADQRDALPHIPGPITRLGLDIKQPLPILTETICMALDGKVFGDAAVNLISGSGKLHMAVLAALLRIGAGVRLVALTADGVRQI